MAKEKHCSVCGTAFWCGPTSDRASCWCNDLPLIMPLDFSNDCQCPACLQLTIDEKITAHSIQLEEKNR